MTPKYRNISFQEKTAYCVVHYVDRDNEEELTVDYDVKIVISGYYEDEGDEDNGFVFIEDEDTDYVDLVMQSGVIPERIKGGYRLDFIDVDDVY